MKHGRHGGNYIPDSYDMNLTADDRLLQQFKHDESEKFQYYLTKFIADKTGERNALSLEDIAKYVSEYKKKQGRKEMRRVQLERFPITRANLADIACAYKLSIEEADDLYAHCGDHLSIYKEHDLEYIRTLANDDTTPDALLQSEYINTEDHRSCLIKLIENHTYDWDTYGREFAEEMKLFKKKATESEVSESEATDLMRELARIIHAEANNYNWIVLEKKDSLTDSKNETERATVFEIASILGFDQAETEALYNSFGYTLSPDCLNFDAYAVWLMEQIKQGCSREGYGYLYKRGCSNIDSTRDGKWRFTAPTQESVEKVLDLKENRYTRESLAKLLMSHKTADYDL